MRFAFTLCLAVTALGCGRIGFDPLQQSVSDASSDTPLDSLADANDQDDALVDTGTPVPSKEVPLNFLQTEVPSFVTTSTAWDPISNGLLSVDVTSSNETWLILLCAQLLTTDPGMRAPEIRYTINGVEVAFSVTTNDSANASYPWSHFAWLSGVSGMQDIQVFARSRDGVSVEIKQLRVLAIRLADDSDPHFAELTTDTTVPASTWTTALSLNVSPSSPGNYLLLALADVDESPSPANVYFRLRDPSGGLWPEMSIGTDLQRLSFNRSNFPLMVLRHYTLSSSPGLFEVQAFGGAGGGSTLHGARIFAFRLDAFEEVASVQNLTQTTVTSTTAITTSSLNFMGVAENRNYLILQSLALASDTSLSETHSRAAEFRVNGVATNSYLLSVDTSPGPILNFSSFSVLNTDLDLIIENTASTSLGHTIYPKESVIYALRFSPAP